jgi:PEP-CTERM motif
MNTKTLAILAATILIPIAVRADTADFSTLAPGTPVTSQFDTVSYYPGLTFSLIYTDASTGTPAASDGEFSSPTEGVSNSPTGDYPTSEYLDVSFNAPVTLNSFFFNNYGDNGLTSYTAFNSMGDVVGTEDISTATSEGASISPELAGIARVQFDNGEDDNEGDNWEYVLGSITYDEAVPEPTTWALLLGGLTLLAFFRFRIRRA